MAEQLIEDLTRLIGELSLTELGESGLLERLHPKTEKLGYSNYKLLIERVKTKEYKRDPHLGDDFVPDTNLYNALGAIYPLLNRAQRDEVIDAHLTQLDRVNYTMAQINHTSKIREPLLLADIDVVRPLYWPGLLDEQHVWKGKRSFAELQKELMTEDGLFDLNKVKSDFLVAYAIMRSDMTPFGEEYAKAANPKFLERVVKGIVALRFARKTAETDIEKGRMRLYELLPESVHDKIEILRQEADWRKPIQHI